MNQDARKTAGPVPSRLGDESDETLAAEIGKGNRDAFQVLMERHVNMHLSFAERMMGNREEAEDIVQDAFTRLWLNAASFDPAKSKFTTWFYRIVMNRCLDVKRKKKPVALPEGFDKEDHRATPAEALHQAERQKSVRDALDQIPDRQRAAIALCYFEGLSNKEAAAVLDMNLKALESLLTRGRKNLQGLLEGVL